MSEMKPCVLLAGGEHRDPAGMIPMLAEGLRLCGCERPRVAYIGAASGDSMPFFLALQLLLQKAGAGEVALVRLAKKRADRALALSQLEGADAIFITGGEVEDGMRWLRQHELTEALWDLRRRGRVFIGLSAGSIMMGAHWVRWRTPGDDSTAELFDCLGFAKTTFDAHAEDEDWAELKTALRLQGTGARGYGIPKSGVVAIGADGRLTELQKALLCYENAGGEVRLPPCADRGGLPFEP